MTSETRAVLDAATLKAIAENHASILLRDYEHGDDSFLTEVNVSTYMLAAINRATSAREQLIDSLTEALDQSNIVLGAAQEGNGKGGFTFGERKWHAMNKAVAALRLARERK